MIRINPETLIFVPNAFTPDGDGKNEVFFATAVGIKDFQLKIFDRWGAVMFETDDPSQGWDGMHPNGTDAVKGVYTWMVFAKGQNDKLIEKRGNLSLLR